MASNDNVRVLYRDGLILGADELSDDQIYFRAALERRSLSRDMYGIAWGLELTAQGGTLVLEPGVAFGGDGQAIVVRAKENLSYLLEGERPDRYAIYLTFRETTDEGGSAFRYCGQALDPRIVEGYEFEKDLVQGTSSYDRRPGARREPQANLQSAGTSAQSRVRLGIVEVDTQGQLKVLENQRAVPCRSASSDGSAEGAEYVGLTAATLTHPRRWSTSLGVEGAKVALEIEPDSGVHSRDPLVVHDGLYWEAGSPVEADFGLSLDALPAPNAAERGLVLKACDPDPAIGEVVLLSANAARVGIHAPLSVDAKASFEQAMLAKDELKVDGETRLRKVTVDGDVTIAKVGGALLTTDKLTVISQANLKQVEVEALTVTGTLVQPANATTVFPAPTIFNQPATFNANVSITGASSLTVAGAAHLNGGIDTVAGLSVAGATNLVGLTATGQADLRGGVAVGLPAVNPGAGELAVAGRASVGGVLVAQNFANLERGVVLTCEDPANLPVGTVVIGAPGVAPGAVACQTANAAQGDRVIGIIGTRLAGNAWVVTSGRAQALVINPGANALATGQWLMVSGTPGVLESAPIGNGGRLVGKALQEILPNTAAPQLIWILVNLA